MKWRSARSAYIQLAYIVVWPVLASKQGRPTPSEGCVMGLWELITCERSGCDHRSYQDAIHAVNGCHRYNQRCIRSKIVSCCVGHVRPVTYIVQLRRRVQPIQLKLVRITRNSCVLCIFVGWVYYVEMDVFADTLTCSTANVLSNPSGI
jgi:hypothetical protein